MEAGNDKVVTNIIRNKKLIPTKFSQQTFYFRFTIGFETRNNCIERNLLQSGEYIKKNQNHTYEKLQKEK